MAFPVASTCRGCGRPIVWATTVDGKKVPLDPVAPVFHRLHDPDSGSAFWIQDRAPAGEVRVALVEHSAVCTMPRPLKREAIT